MYDKVKHLTDCTFYTDEWESFIKVLPKERHVIGKQHTHGIERDNSNTRHNLARMTRRTKVVSKAEEMMNITMKLWCHLRTPEIFQTYQSQFLSVFNGLDLV